MLTWRILFYNILVTWGRQGSYYVWFGAIGIIIGCCCTNNTTTNAQHYHHHHHQHVFRGRGSAYDIGVQYGKQFQMELENIYNYKTQHQHVNVIEQWKEMATSPILKTTIQQHAPFVWMELVGIYHGSGKPLDHLLMLATEYEAEMMESLKTSPSNKTTSKGCTGFAIPTNNNNDYSCMGQTNDDHPAHWGNGTWDVVLYLELEEIDYHPVMVYSHIGVSAYFGMRTISQRASTDSTADSNNVGFLGVTWYYIDDASRNTRYDGLPTTILLRQILYHPFLKDAVDFLQNVPKLVPNAFLLLGSWPTDDHVHESDDGTVTHNTTTTIMTRNTTIHSVIALSVEVSPTSVSIMPSKFLPLVHANHILHNEEMWQNEVRLKNLDIGHKSVNRYRTLRTLLDQELLWIIVANQKNDNNTHNNDDAFVKKLITMLQTPPIYNIETLSTVIMNPKQGCFYILWYNTSQYQTICALSNATTFGTVS